MTGPRRGTMSDLSQRELFFGGHTPCELSTSILTPRETNAIDSCQSSVGQQIPGVCMVSSELVSKTSVFVTLSLTVSRIPADEMPGHTSHGRLWLWISASQFADEREDSTLYYETV